MKKDIKEYKLEWGGKELRVEIGRLAHQTNAACIVQYGETIVLATAVMAKEPKENAGYFPLMVDYEEKMYAAGKIKSSRFIKRETKPTDEAVLTSRLIDRGARPLFNEKMRNDVQVVVTVLQVDGENDPDIAAIFATSCALHTSNIPWNGPLVGVRIGQIGGEWVINPTYVAREKSDFELTACYTSDGKVINIECGANQVPDEVIYEAFEFGLKHSKKPLKLLEEIRKDLGQEKIVINYNKEEEVEDENQKASLEDLKKLIEETKKYAHDNIDKYLFNVPVGSKTQRKEKVYALKNEIVEMLQAKNTGKDRIKKALEFFDTFIEERVTEAILKEGKRVDGRGLDDVRPLSADVGLFSRIHGSGLFSRGETQVLSMTTLGAPGDEQVMDGMEIVGKKHFMHHYNFPPYSVGEAASLRSTGRREIGHGALAEKAIIPVLPKREDFPYTIRVVSEVMGSNGSSSMASTCGCSLSLMDAGVPIKKPVAGIAIGLASDSEGNYKILTDIQDLEDGQGGMDFKVTGTDEGITAIQMDTKTLGLTMEQVKEALEKGKQARLKILEVMNKAISAPRENLSPFAPRIVTLHINPDSIRTVIGPGGKMINAIIDKTGVNIDIEDDGTVFVTSASEAGMNEAIEWIKNLTREAKIGEVFTGKVIKIADFGAFVEIFPGQEGMVHISEITNEERVNDVRKYLKEGQSIKVKVIKVDPATGKVGLSIKQAN